MIERFVDLGVLTQEVSGQLVAAMVLAAGSVTYVAGELWTEDKVREGVKEHEQAAMPRLERIESNAQAVRENLSEVRSEITGIKAELRAIHDSQDRTERMVETLLRRQLQFAPPPPNSEQ